MDEEVKTGEMTGLGDDEDITTIEEDYTKLESDSIKIDDDSDLQNDALYNQALEYKEVLDEVKTEMKDILLAVLEKGEINANDTNAIEQLQEQYIENYTTLKTLTIENNNISDTNEIILDNTVTSDNLIETLLQTNILDVIADKISLTAEHIDLNGYVSNNSDDPNWSITADGNMEAKNLSVEGDLSADMLSINKINSPQYPATLDATIDIFVNYDSGNDDYSLDEVLESIDEADETGSEDIIKKFKTVKGAITQLPKFLNGKTVNIHMETDTTENVTISYFGMGKINIYLGGKTFNGYIKFYGNEAPVFIYGGTVDSPDRTGYIHPYTALEFNNRNASIGADTCRYVGLYNLQVYGADNTANAGNVCCVMSQGGSNVYCSNVAISSCDIGFRANNMTQIQMNSSSGIASKYGFQAHTGGKISFGNSSQAGGVTAATNKDSGGQIWADGATFASGSATTGDKNASAPTTTVTATYTSNYGDTYRSTVYNSWKKDNTCRQGDWGYGDCTGVWFFGTQFAELKGKTITKVTITISRQSSANGNNSAVEHKIWMHNHSTRPSGAPTLNKSWSTTFTLTRGETKTITITNSTVLNAIKNGTCKGFAIRHTYDGSHYSVCSGNATVKITYQE